jgi:hypothetical protein
MFIALPSLLIHALLLFSGAVKAENTGFADALLW